MATRSPVLRVRSTLHSLDQAFVHRVLDGRGLGLELNRGVHSFIFRVNISDS
jgi:hypothetical protein